MVPICLPDTDVLPYAAAYVWPMRPSAWTSCHTPDTHADWCRCAFQREYPALPLTCTIVHRCHTPTRFSFGAASCVLFARSLYRIVIYISGNSSPSRAIRAQVRHCPRPASVSVVRASSWRSTELWPLRCHSLHPHRTNIPPTLRRLSRSPPDRLHGSAPAACHSTPRRIPRSPQYVATPRSHLPPDRTYSFCCDTYPSARSQYLSPLPWPNRSRSAFSSIRRSNIGHFHPIARSTISRAARTAASMNMWLWWWSYCGQPTPAFYRI